MVFSKVITTSVICALTVLMAACAPQPAGIASAPPAAGLSGPPSAATATKPMQGMDHSNMPGMQGHGHEQDDGPLRGYASAGAARCGDVSGHAPDDGGVRPDGPQHGDGTHIAHSLTPRLNFISAAVRRQSVSSRASALQRTRGGGSVMPG